MHDNDDDAGFEPGEDRRLLVDVPLPDYVATLSPTATLDELAAAYHMTVVKDVRNEHIQMKLAADWYRIMLGRLAIARMSWQHFAAKRAAAGTRSDGAAVMNEFDQFGKDQCAVEKAQWRKYLRLSHCLGEIHKRTLAMQADQKAARKPVTFPSLNTLNADWFPADPDAHEFKEVKRQAQLDAVQSLRNQKEEERSKQFMQAVDAATEAKQTLERERQERWDAETELRKELAARDAQIAELTAQRVEPARDEQTAEPTALRAEQNAELEALRAELAARDEQITQLTARLADMEARLTPRHEPPSTANDTTPEPPSDPASVGTEPPVDDVAASPTEPSGEPVEAMAAQEPETASEPPVELRREPEPVVDRHAAVVDLLPNPASPGIATRDLSARLGFDARATLEDLITEKRAALQDTTSANPEEWRWTRYPDAPEPVEPPAEPETTEESPTEQVTETEANDVIYWAELDAVSAARLCERVLTAADLPDLTSDRLPDEEKELGFDRRGKALKPKPPEPEDLDIVARRLKLATVRCAKLTGRTEEVELLTGKYRKWFGEHRHLPVGRVIHAARPSIPPVTNKEDVA